MPDDDSRFASFVRKNFVGFDDNDDGFDPTDPDTRIVSSRINVEDAARLDFLAPQFGMSKSALIAQIIDMGITEIYKSLDDQLTDHIEYQVMELTGLPNERVRVQSSVSPISEAVQEETQ